MATRFTVCFKSSGNTIGFARLVAFGIENALRTARTIWGSDRIINIKG